MDVAVTPPTLIDHLRNEIRSKDLTRRANGLIDLIALTKCPASCGVQFRSIPGRTLSVNNDAGVGTAIDLTALVPDLLRVYRAGPRDGHRLLALTALLNIGDEPGIESLVERPPRVSVQVATVTKKRIAAFYLERYPELLDRAVRTGTFSTEDVRMARDRQARMARKQKRTI